MSDPTPAQQLMPLLAALDRAFRADIKRHAGLPEDVTLAQFQVVTLLADAARCSQTQIAQHLGVTGPTVVRIVDALEHKGLVVRTRERADRRVVWVTLTEQGTTLQRACARWHRSSWRRCWAGCRRRPPRNCCGRWRLLWRRQRRLQRGVASRRRQDRFLPA